MKRTALLMLNRYDGGYYVSIARHGTVLHTTATASPSSASVAKAIWWCKQHRYARTWLN